MGWALFLSSRLGTLREPPPAGSGMKPRLKTGFGSFCARNLRGDKYRLVFLTLMATSDIRTGHEKLQQWKGWSGPPEFPLRIRSCSSWRSHAHGAPKTLSWWSVKVAGWLATAVWREKPQSNNAPFTFTPGFTKTITRASRQHSNQIELAFKKSGPQAEGITGVVTPRKRCGNFLGHL